MARRASSRGSGARRNRAKVKRKKKKPRKREREGGREAVKRSDSEIGEKYQKAENIFIRRVVLKIRYTVEFHFS